MHDCAARSFAIQGVTRRVVAAAKPSEEENSMSSESIPNVPEVDAPRTACRHLRSKGMYITGCMNPEEEHDEVGDGHCWCNLTQNVQGPDDGFVGRSLCVSARTCFVPLLTISS